MLLNHSEIKSENKLGQLKEKGKYRRQKDMKSFLSQLSQPKPHYSLPKQCIFQVHSHVQGSSHLRDFVTTTFTEESFSALQPLQTYLPKTIR